MRTGEKAKTSLKRQVMSILAGVPDPEIPAISIVELGIVRGVDLSSPTPCVAITPTYSGCPATWAIEQAVRAALDQAGQGHIHIKTVLSPPWNTDWITEEGREKLRAYGVAPPPRGAEQSALRNMDVAECPRCASRQTVEISRFGSTPCKALWRCETCLEPFDRFKCH